MTVYVASLVVEVIIPDGALFMVCTMNLRAPQKVNPSPLPHAKLTESASKRVTYETGSPLAMVTDLVGGFYALFFRMY